MKYFLRVFGFLFFSFMGGAVGANLVYTSAGQAAYQMISVWTGAAGSSIPPWPNSHFGFGGVKTSSQSITPFASPSAIGGWGGYFATRASDNDSSGNTYPSGLNTLAVLDATGTGVWGNYIQGEMTTSSTHQLLNTESSIYNSVTPVTNVDPFNLNVGNLNVNLRLDCGTGQASPTNCGTALQVLNNGAKYSNPPIMVGSNSIDTSLNANPPAIAVPTTYSMAWYASAGVIGSSIFSGSGSPAGVVTCTNRCLYLRTDGAAGSTLYVNETGGGTSGWAAK